MKESILIFATCTALAVLTASCNGRSANQADESRVPDLLVHEITADMEENLLPFWKRHSVDHDDPRQGFFGRIAHDGTGIGDARKFNVLFARYLWTWSAAFRVLGDIESRRLADRAFNYISTYFIDHEHGGMYWILNADGSLADSSKITYGQSFAIYAFSEYYRATNNEESLRLAIDIYRLLEKKVKDREHGGYLEGFTDDWHYREEKGLAEGRIKSMNTHLHLLEAYTNLYRVWPDSQLRESLEHLVDIFFDHIVDTNRYHQDLFFGRDWTVDGRYDSYGHDIEFSWLFYEAAEVLGDTDLLERVSNLSIKIAEKQLSAGLNHQGAMIYEKMGEGLYRRNISWWVQAEAVVGFLNAWEISGNPDFFDAAAGVWEYIKGYMIDYQHGGWHPDLDEHGTPVPGRLKGDEWTCPYHNVRMGLEVHERFYRSS